MKLTIPIPKQMAHLPIDDRGYPIPFFAPIIDGKPEFKFTDRTKVRLAISKKICHVCGKPLIKGNYYFVSGPKGLKNRVTSEAAMHKECAEFSMAACPHLHFQKAERKVMADIFAPVINEKPEIIYLIRANKFKIIELPEIKSFVVRFSVVSTRKFVYKDNILQEEI
jgi:hypothetical protein